ncbi:M28 family peptidase, partial [bacterium]|nr:M28 family peptidase [bacterium]
QFRSEDVELPYSVSDNLNILIKHESARLLFKEARYNLADVIRFDENGIMRSFPLETKASFSGQFKERDFIASNVAALLPGEDPLLLDSFLLLAAHYDHLGMAPGAFPDSVYNGVVDNALGVSAVLEIAYMLASISPKPRRSILFLFLTGEEKGLLGSRFYCDQPLVPLHQTIAVINVDGIAIIDEFGSITGVGSELSTLESVLAEVARESGLTVSPVPEIFSLRDPLTSSDHYSFLQAGIPSVLIMEGFDYKHLSRIEGIRRFIKWGETVYHTPTDDLKQPINYDAVMQHIQIIGSLALKLSNTFTGPEWLPGSKFIRARLRSLAENR